MRIIGGHDYYDAGLAFGRDESLIFLRNGDRRHNDSLNVYLGYLTRLCNARLSKGDGTDGVYLNPRHYAYGNNVVKDRNYSHTITHAYVVLCGVLYSGFHIYREGRMWSDRANFWIWKPDNLRHYATSNGLSLDEDHRTDRNRSANGHQSLTLEEYLTPVKLGSDARRYLIENRITIASLNPTIYRRQDGMNWLIDQASLKDMEFGKAVDPYTAFQEISMWIGGVIPRDGPEIVEIVDNKIKIEKHGFHHPTSFRKAKEHK